MYLSRFEMKHMKHLEEARAGSAAAVKELEQLQNEKRKMLMEHETAKLKVRLDDLFRAGPDIRSFYIQYPSGIQIQYLSGY